MANTPSSSFIPRQTTSAAPKKVQHQRVFSIVGFFATAILIASLVAAAAIFVYKEYVLDRQLAEREAALNAEGQKFDESEIDRVQKFDTRLSVANLLLNRHIAPSKIFAALEQNTKQSVQFTGLTYTKRPSGNVTLSLTGATEEFTTVALQSMQNLSTMVLQEAVVTQVSSGAAGESGNTESGAAPEGQVSFSLVANVPRSEVRYQPGSTPVPVTPPVSTSTPDTIGTSTPATGDADAATTNGTTTPDTSTSNE